MPQVEFTTTLPVSPAEAFAWHARPGALHRLLPPGDAVRIVSQQPAPGATSILDDGGRVTLAMDFGLPARLHWIARHEGCRPGESFRDVLERGPIARWRHEHVFSPHPDGCLLSDRIDYAAGFPACLLAWAIRRGLPRMFGFRHLRTRHDLAAHARFPSTPRTIAITGANGLVGSALVPFLTTGRHRVLTIGRRDADVRWDPRAGTLDAARLEGVDAVIHLAGENVAQRWSSAAKARIRDSRVQGTALIARTIAALKAPPRVLVVASGIGAYGTHDDDAKRSEDAAYGDDFLAGVCRDWEAAAEPARAAGIRVVHVRIGMVVSLDGGALTKMYPAFWLGAGGPVGGGRQWMSWIQRDDLIDVLHRAVMDERLSGPVNAVSPQTVRQREFAATLGRVMRRPAFAPLPGFVVSALFGEMGRSLLLGGTRAAPTRLKALKHPWRFADLESALRFEFGR